MSEPNDKLRLVKAEKGAGNTIAMTGNEILARLDDIKRSRTPVYRIVRLADGELAPQSIEIEQLQAMPESERAKKQFVVHKDWELHIHDQEFQSIDPFVERLKTYTSMSAEERVAEVSAIRHQMEELRKSDIPAEAKAVAIMGAVERTFLINKAALKPSKAEVGEPERAVAAETRSFVGSVIAMVDEANLIGPLFQTFAGLSNGQTLNHIARVFGITAGFLHYFNKLHQRRIAQSIRMVFNEAYLPFYRALFPRLEDIYLSADSMVQLASFSPPDMKEYALGAFLHDIGKLANLDYFESDKAFDPKQIRDHVYIGAGLILINYGTEHERARLMAGDHHNALFHEAGYGVSREERKRSPRQLKETVHCVSYLADDFISGKALGFLPSEMLSIVDVYDAMTDASRTYKKAMTPDEALVFMEEKFVQTHKFDFILFDLFVDYLRELKLVSAPGLGFSAKAAQRH